MHKRGKQKAFVLENREMLPNSLLVKVRINRTEKGRKKGDSFGGTIGGGSTARSLLCSILKAPQLVPIICSTGMSFWKVV